MEHKIKVSSRAIIIHNEKILLNCFGNSLYYNFPGGGIEKNETAPEAVIREVYEESGLCVEVKKHLFTFEYEPEHCKNQNGETHHISIFFECKIIGSFEITPPIVPDTNPDDKTIKSHAVWISLNKLKETPFVPNVILEPLINFTKTGIFEPSFFENQ